MNLTGFEKFSVDVKEISIKGITKVKTDSGIEFEATVRIDTEQEMDYYTNGGIL